MRVKIFKVMFAWCIGGGGGDGVVPSTSAVGESAASTSALSPTSAAGEPIASTSGVASSSAACGRVCCGGVKKKTGTAKGSSAKSEYAQCYF